MQKTTAESSMGVLAAKNDKRKGLFRALRRAWAITGITLWVMFLTFQFFANRPTGPAQEAMRSDAAVRVTRQRDHWLFEPTAADAKRAGLIFFPGSLVDPVAYAPLARSAAAHGYTAVIVPLPLRIAPLKSQKAAVTQSAADIVSRSREAGIGRWVISGHSLGGVFAARFAREYPDLTDGLVLVGTSHPRDFDLSESGLDVTKISGSRDGLASLEEVRRYAGNLPKSTRWIEIDGGNHAQFGWYGPQFGDHTATIGHAEQQSRLSSAVLAALARAAARPSR
jgi:pimeloyl-ACP methyl ester carboxylesterase